MTHINVAFENPKNDAGDMSFNRKDAGLIAQAHAKGVKVLVSIGGGSSNKAMNDRWAQLSSELMPPALPANWPSMSPSTVLTAWTWTLKARRSTKITGPSLPHYPRR